MTTRTFPVSKVPVGARSRRSVELLRAAFPDIKNPLSLIVADVGDIAVSYGRVTGTNTGELWGLPATGGKIDYETIGILRFRDGHAVE